MNEITKKQLAGSESWTQVWCRRAVGNWLVIHWIPFKNLKLQYNIDQNLISIL